jgi:hypothetical protein
MELLFIERVTISSRGRRLHSSMGSLVEVLGQGAAPPRLSFKHPRLAPELCFTPLPLALLIALRLGGNHGESLWHRFSPHWNPLVSFALFLWRFAKL